MQIDVRTNTKKLLKDVSRLFKSQIPFATSKALNSLAYGLRGWEMAQMPAHLDRPTPFSLRGVRYIRSNKRNLVATVYLTEQVDSYLKYQIHGGQRAPKGKAHKIPTKHARRNAYGNLTKGYVNSQIKKKKVFSGKPRGGNRPAGIWERTGKNNRLKPLLIWENGSITYNKRFDWYGIGRKYIKQNFDKEFIKAMEQAIKSAK